jgi:CubicO group peptidase (beta-lactamase class C family)
MIRSLLLAALLMLAGCSTQSPSVSEEEPRDLPDRFEMAAAYAEAHAGDALVVWDAGEIVLERAQNGYDLDEPHYLASGTKSFAGVAALAAVADGHLSLDDRVAETIPAWRDDPPKSKITVRQLLHLTSGLDPGEAGGAPTFDDAIQAPMLDAPDTTFRYGPLAFQVFGALLQRVLDGEDPLRYYERRFFDPVAIEVGDWARVDRQDPQLAGGAWLTARDWLRFGRLLLNDGRWEGEQLLPAGLLDSLTAPTPASPGYGLTVWLNAAVDPGDPFFEHAPPSLQPDGPEGMIYADGPSDLFMAAGLFNQRLYVVPSREMVVVRFGRADATWNDAEFLARLLDGRAYEASTRAKRPLSERVGLLTSLRLRQLDTAVDLTEAQENALHPIVEKQMRALAQMQREQSGSMSRRERRRRFRQFRTVQRQTDRAIEAELNAEQVEAYRAFRDEQRTRWREAWREQR